MNVAVEIVPVAKVIMGPLFVVLMESVLTPTSIVEEPTPVSERMLSLVTLVALNGKRIIDHGKGDTGAKADHKEKRKELSLRFIIFLL